MRTFGVFHDVVPPTAKWRMSLAERHGAILKVLMMKIVREKAIVGLDEMSMAATSATSSRPRLSGFSPVQIVFGKENPWPGNLLDATDKGHWHYQLSAPSGADEALRRQMEVRAAAEDAWEPPPSRRGLGRRLQDNTSWFGPGIVVALERKDGAIKRVWVRWRNKLRGFPLKFVRLATVDELQSTEITVEAMREMEEELRKGRLEATVWTPPQPDPEWPVQEFSDEEESLSTDEDKRQVRARAEASGQGSVGQRGEQRRSVREKRRATPTWTTSL